MELVVEEHPFFLWPNVVNPSTHITDEIDFKLQVQQPMAKLANNNNFNQQKGTT